ncbi:MAG: hypothetical protein ACJAUL_001759 [Paraglaciecola sp.]|jgi:hypothetical protein
MGSEAILCSAPNEKTTETIKFHFILMQNTDYFDRDLMMTSELVPTLNAVCCDSIQNNLPHRGFQN